MISAAIKLMPANVGWLFWWVHKPMLICQFHVGVNENTPTMLMPPNFVCWCCLQLFVYVANSCSLMLSIVVHWCLRTVVCWCCQLLFINADSCCLLVLLDGVCWWCQLMFVVAVRLIVLFYAFNSLVWLSWFRMGLLILLMQLAIFKYVDISRP